MSTPNPAPIYQLRIRLERISPLIWRRLLVTDATTIAELHTTIQIALGWSDAHLHRLADFRFRVGERFSYEYNFHVPWRHEIRIEQIGSAAPGQHYPVCIGGARAAPPEECGGPNDFLALRQHYHSLHVIGRLLALRRRPRRASRPLRRAANPAVLGRGQRLRPPRHQEAVATDPQPGGGALMKITVQLVIEPEDGPAVVTEVATLARETLTDETLGLSLAEGNRILAGVQEAVVVQQDAAYIAKQQTCPQCGAAPLQGAAS
jgi:Plasmid pRiA4b ORF-3-like protein